MNKILYFFTNNWFVVGVFKPDVAQFWEDKLKKKGFQTNMFDVELPETAVPNYLELYK